MVLSLCGVESSFLKIFNDVLDNVLCCSFFRSVETFKESLSPNDAMDQFFWFLPDGADWERLVFLSLNALVARSASLDYADASHVIAVGSGVHKGQSQIEAH